MFRRHNYTTPKSFLELISLYKALLARKREELRQAKERLENGAAGCWGCWVHAPAACFAWLQDGMAKLPVSM